WSSQTRRRVVSRHDVVGIRTCGGRPSVPTKPAAAASVLAGEASAVPGFAGEASRFLLLDALRAAFGVRPIAGLLALLDGRPALFGAGAPLGPPRVATRLASLPARLGGRRLRAAVELAAKEHRVAPPLLDAAAREAPQHAPAVIAFADAFAARPPAEARPDDARVLLGRGPAEVERRHGLEDL